MKLRQLVITATVIMVAACNKDKFTTIPQLTLKSISPGTVFSGNVITLKGSYTDKEGDIDSVFVVRKFFAGNTATKIDTIERFRFAALNLPGKTLEADIELTYEYNTQNLGIRTLSGVQKDTTAAFGMILKDKAANRSEYKESEKIRLKKP